MEAQIFVQYQPMVRRIARKAAATFGLPSGVDADDLESAGLIALAEAWDRFDSARGVAFEAYACLRVRGAVIDCIRASDWVPRKTRERIRKVTTARDQLHDQLGRAPSDAEVAAAAGVRDVSHAARLISLDALVECAGEATDLSDFLGETEESDRLPVALDVLSERDRLIVTLHYLEGVPLGHIANVLGVTESRVSQLHARALHGLKESLGAA